MNLNNSGTKPKRNNIKEKFESKWIVRSMTDKIQQELDTLGSAMPDDYQYMMNHLATTPFLPLKSTAFKMKHIDAFEYRLPKFNRVYYVIYGDVRLVVIYYAGEHPDCPAPLTSHQLILVKQITREVEILRREQDHNAQHTSDVVYRQRKRRR